MSLCLYGIALQASAAIVETSNTHIYDETITTTTRAFANSDITVKSQPWSNQARKIADVGFSLDEKISVMSSSGDIYAYNGNTGSELYSLGISQINLSNPFSMSIDQQSILASYGEYTGSEPLTAVLLLIDLGSRGTDIFQSRRGDSVLNDKVSHDPRTDSNSFVVISFLYNESAPYNTRLKDAQIELYNYSLGSSPTVTFIEWFDLEETKNSTGNVPQNSNVAWSMGESVMRLFVTTVLSSKVFQFDVQNNKLTLVHDFSVGDTEVLVFALSADASLYAVNAFERNPFAPVLMVVNASTGQQIWKQNLKDLPEGVPYALMFAPNNKDLVVAYDIRIESGGPVYYPPNIYNISGQVNGNLDLAYYSKGATDLLLPNYEKESFVAVSRMEVPAQGILRTNVTAYSYYVATPTPLVTGSVIPTFTVSPSPGPDGKTCFPASSKVQLENGQWIRMDELAVGDRVYVSDAETSEVHMFGHRLKEGIYDFVHIDWSQQALKGSLRLSPDHMIYVNGKLVPASQIQTGDFLSLANNSSARVVGAKLIKDRGLYHPHTLAGDIIVDGVKVSCYTNLFGTRFAPWMHSLLMPLRLAFRGFELNVLGSFLESGISKISVTPNQLVL